MTIELDQTYRTVAARLPNNSALRFDGERGKEELILSPLENNEEPESMVILRKSVADRMPQVDLTEILLEITVRAGLADAFTHVSEQTARSIDLDISLCAVMLGEACNTGIEPLVCTDAIALRRDRLAWVDPTYTQFAFLGALPIFYLVLLKIGIIEMKTIEAILPTVMVLKSVFQNLSSNEANIEKNFYKAFKQLNSLVKCILFNHQKL